VVNLDCGCYINIDGRGYFYQEIHFCPLHAAAEATAVQRDRLLEIGNDLLTYLEAHAVYLPQGVTGSFRQREPLALRDRLRILLAAEPEKQEV